MRTAHFLAYWLQTLAAYIAWPLMRVSGFRFGKSWRGNWIVNHVHANMLADGIQPGFCKFFNRYI